jgi:hypothetical protein
LQVEELVYSSATCSEDLMSWANATARRIGGAPAGNPLPSGDRPARFASPFQHPTILVASSRRSSPPPPANCACSGAATNSSSTVRTSIL